MARRPRRAFATLVVVAVLAMTLGVVVGRTIRSPAQKVIDTQPPPYTRITARVLAPEAKGTVVARGKVSVGQTIAVGPIQSSSALSVITNVFVKPGERASAGTRLIEVSGRPIYLLPGAFPAYRDLKVGESGPDAKQLNAALRTLGFSAPEADTYTRESSQALAALYARHGYTAPTAGSFDRREFVFAANLPGTVTNVGAAVGSVASQENLVTLSSGQSRVTATVPSTMSETIKPGGEAAIDLDGSGKTTSAIVESVRPAIPATSTTVVLVPSEDIPHSLNGADVRVTITQKLAESTGVSVPVSAVYSQPDGRTVVLLLDGSDEHVIPVQVGAVTNGMAAVSPVGTGILRVGDRVIVSRP